VLAGPVSHILPIGGGKGGSGKTFITGSLGILLAKQGYTTLLIDVDFGTANLHTILGIPHPERSISDFVNKRVESLQETIVPTSVSHLYFISGAMNNLDIANLAHEQKMRILRNIVKLPYEYVLLDLGAGTSFNTIDFFMISSHGIFVTTPEPTSVENIYRLVRSVYFRKVRQLFKAHEFRMLVEEAQKQHSRTNVSNPDFLLRTVKEMNPDSGAMLERKLGEFRFKLVLNQLRKQDDPQIGALICKIIERHLFLKMDFIGNVSFDDNVHSAVCRNIPFLDLYPYTQAAFDLRECCKNLLSLREAHSALQSAGD